MGIIQGVYHRTGKVNVPEEAQHPTYIWKVVRQRPQGSTNLGLGGSCRKTHFRYQEVNRKVIYEK